MVTVPADTPLTTPVPDITVAMVTSLELHVIPVEVVLKVIVLPIQTFVGPDIAAGRGFTVTTLVELQPVPKEVVIVAVPADWPVTMPVKEPTVAIVLSLLLQLPPGEEEVNVVDCPTHTVAVPAI